VTGAVIFFLAGALVLAGALGAHSIALRILGAWMGLALVVIASAYALNKPGLLMKNAGGSLPLHAWFILGPFLFANHLLLLLRRTFSTEQAAHEIVPRLWLGRWPGFDGVRKLRAAGIRSILDLTCEFPRRPALDAGAAYLNLGVLDYTPPNPEQLRRAVAFISDRLPIGPVYVHCAVGHGRGAMVVAAWLVASGRERHVSQAVALVRSRRSRVRLTRAQQRALRAFVESHDHEG
jgi:hypothetical protein